MKPTPLQNANALITAHSNGYHDVVDQITGDLERGDLELVTCTLIGAVGALIDQLADAAGISSERLTAEILRRIGAYEETS